MACWRISNFTGKLDLFMLTGPAGWSRPAGLPKPGNFISREALRIPALPAVWPGVEQSRRGGWNARIWPGVSRTRTGKPPVFLPNKLPALRRDEPGCRLAGGQPHRTGDMNYDLRPDSGSGCPGHEWRLFSARQKADACSAKGSPTPKGFCWPITTTTAALDVILRERALESWRNLGKARLRGCYLLNFGPGQSRAH